MRNHENGTNGIRADVAHKYAQILGVSVSWLLYGEGEEPKIEPPTKASSDIALRSNGNGTAMLEVRKVVPMATALKIMALLEGGE